MLFNAATLMMGTFGAATLAAHQIALNLAGLAFMIPLGMLLDRLSYRMALKRWMKSQGRA